MKNLNFLLVIFLIVTLSCVLYVKYNKTKVINQPPVIDDSGVAQETEPVKPPDIEEPVLGPKVEILSSAKSYNEALKMAKEHNRPVFMLFEASWCIWCKSLEKTLLLMKILVL